MSDQEERNSDSDEHSLDDLEREIMNEHKGSEDSLGAHDPHGAANLDNVEIPIDPIVNEFGAENDEGVIQTVKSGDNLFFFVESAGPIENDEESYFHKLGHLWQGVKMTPPRYDENNIEIETDPDDTRVVYAELYLPKIVAELDKQSMYEYLEEGAWALQKLYFPVASTNSVVSMSKDNNSNVAKVLNNDMPKVLINDVPKVLNNDVDSSKAIGSNGNDPAVDTSKLESTLLKFVEAKKSENEKKEEKIKRNEHLADLVFKDTDIFIPEKEKVTLSLSEPILPAVLGLLKKDRRLTPTSWKKLKLEKYNLSPDQTKQLGPLSNLTGSEEEETIFDSLAPPLARALSGLLKKKVDLNLPTYKMFDILWRSKATNTSEFATPLKSLPEAQKMIDVLLECIQHQIMTNSLLTYQIKLQIGNIISGLAKDNVTSKVMQHRIQENLDHNPGRSVMGNMTKTVADLNKTRKSLAKGFSLLGKRPASEVSLTATKQAKKQKLYNLSSKNRWGDLGGGPPSSVRPPAARARGRGSGPSRGAPQFIHKRGNPGGSNYGNAARRGGGARGGGGGPRGGRGSHRGGHGQSDGRGGGRY